MKTLKLSILALGLACAGFAGCGSNGPSNNDAPVVVPDAPVVVPDAPVVPGPDGGVVQQDASMGEVPIQGTSGTYVDCTGLTPAQCHDRIINPPTVPETVVTQPTGAAPAPGYPACTAI